MKKVLIILISFLLLVFLYSTVLAIERVPKKGDSTSGERKEEVKSESSAKAKEEETPLEKETREKIELKKTEKEEEKGIFRIIKKVKPEQKKELREKYDYFIDKNGNGIDDRLEKRKAEKETEKEPEKKKASSERKARGRR